MADDYSLRGSTFELGGAAFTIESYTVRPTDRTDGKIDVVITTTCGRSFEIDGMQMVRNSLIDDPPCVDCGDEDEARAVDVRDGKVRCWACLPEPEVTNGKPD